MDFSIIKAPTEETLDILIRRKRSKKNLDLDKTDAVGLVQGKLIDMVVAADIAAKAVGVIVEDI